MKSILLLVIKLYQKLISPLMAPRCRFYPSCSSYAIDALNEHGIISGLYFSLKRILSCHPFSDGGVDFVPRKKGPSS